MIYSPLEQFSILSIYDWSLWPVTQGDYCLTLLESNSLRLLQNIIYPDTLNLFPVSMVSNIITHLAMSLSGFDLLPSMVCSLGDNKILSWLWTQYNFTIHPSYTYYTWPTQWGEWGIIYAQQLHNSHVLLTITPCTHVFGLIIEFIKSWALYIFVSWGVSLATLDSSYLILSVNTSTIWLTIGFTLFTFIFITILQGVTLISTNRWQTLLELFYDFILNIVNENAGNSGVKFFPLIFTTFTLIFICNILGMIPYSFTVTSHLIVTFSMALAIFIGINILGILKNGKHFLSLFFPPGAPLGLAPLLVFIELVSYVFRVLSLAIRLFANLMSGHTLLKILSGYAWIALSFYGLFIIPLIVILLVTGLEIAIAFLQAYIFSVLLCIYINDAFNLH